jgi:hypothetical protein
MNAETTSSEERVQISVKESSKLSRPAKTLTQEILDSLKSAQEDIGQISELSSEEETLVVEFFESLSKLMESVSQNLPISPEMVSKYFNGATQASLDASGHLLVLYSDGRMELKNLRTEKKHRDLMVSVLEDLLPKFEQLFSDQRQKIEDRTRFLSMVTKETQKMSRALSKPDT